MGTNEIRTKFLAYFQERQHTVIPRANLVPQDDPTTLFTGSGMQPLLPFLLGETHPEGARLTNSQPSFRAEDIDEVGDNRHTTFFEMLGNWSLGDYFKREQLEWFFSFLTEELKLDPDKLYVTVFAGDVENEIPRDDESAEFWQELFKSKDVEAKTVELLNQKTAAQQGMQDGRIFYYDVSKNWWSRTGMPKDMPAGEPGGPDSEVFYEFSEVEHDPKFGEKCHPNCDCGRYLEIGNSVFMQYVKNQDGSFSELPQKNVDFGGGLERLAAAVRDEADVFKIDSIWPVIEKLCEASGKEYRDHVVAKRVIADHVRSAVFMAADGVTPSNNQQGYVLRRLIRRAVRQGLQIGLDQDLMKTIAPTVTAAYQDAYPELVERSEVVSELLAKEESVFRQTLRRGLREFDKQVTGSLGGKTVFTLFDTYGFPPELSLEEAKDRGVSVAKDWQKEFDSELAAQRERSRTAAKGKFKGGLGGESAMHKRYHTATHLLYRVLREVLGDHVVQRGSNITDERLRFDFSHPEKMTDEEIKQVEELVNTRIAMDLEVTAAELPTKEALKKGAYGAFGDKYGDTVKVYSMQDKEGKKYSFEICGGPHVGRTSELTADGKRFKIVKEQSSSAGVRRIKAVLA